MRYSREEQEKRYKYEVEKTGEYEYIKFFSKGEILPNGRTVGKTPYMQIKHKYCGSIYEIETGGFINKGIRCSRCCQTYENSLAYYIEVDLGLKLEDVWDFDKNVVNPFYINKNSQKRIWIKCQEKDYHGSYEVAISRFIGGKRCPCCSSTGRKISPKDSFAQYHTDNTDKDFLDKYWSDKNTVSPWEISPMSHKKVWIKCANNEINELNGIAKKDYHTEYEVRVSAFTRGSRCPYCCARNKVHRYDSFAYYHIHHTDSDFLDKYWDWDKNNELGIDPWSIAPKGDRFVWLKCQNEEINELNGLMKKDYHPSYLTQSKLLTIGSKCSFCSSQRIHPYDSFGYYNFNKVQSWHPDNDISPFRVSKSSGKKYNFICETCEHEWSTSLDSVTIGRWCPVCRASKGEKRIKQWLIQNNVDYIFDEGYFEDLKGISGGLLRPDFILPDYKIWIEYDGEFHFKDYYKDGSYERLVKHDKLKDEYAEKYDWKMIRIPYTDFDNIENILEKELNLNNKMEER